MAWYYEGRELTSEDLVGMAGFVYEITDLDTDMMYIGKKKATSTRKTNPTKKNGLKRAKRVTSESDWMDYYGSNDAIKQLLVEHGPERFHRRVLRLCKTTSEMTYFEMKEQIDREVLLRPTEFYNRFVGGKLHGSHLKHLHKDKA